MYLAYNETLTLATTGWLGPGPHLVSTLEKRRPPFRHYNIDTTFSGAELPPRQPRPPVQIDGYITPVLRGRNVQETPPFLSSFPVPFLFFTVFPHHQSKQTHTRVCEPDRIFRAPDLLAALLSFF